MIKNYKSKAADELLHTGYSRLIPNKIQRAAERKLLQLHAAQALNELRYPPGNHLEILSGDRAGQYSIRINKQWRVCFRWNAGNAHDVEITDYH